MVGGLIQKQDIRLVQQKLSQGDTGFLSAGQGGNLLGKVFFLESQTFQHADNLAFAGVAVFLLKTMVQAGIEFHQRFQIRRGCLADLFFQRTDPAFQIQDVLLGGQKFLVDGPVGGNVLVLGEIADGFVPGQDDLTESAGSS